MAKRGRTTLLRSTPIRVIRHRCRRPGRVSVMRRARLLLRALTMIAVGCSGDSGTDAASTATEPTKTEVETGTVFSWSADDLSEWVTEEEMTDALIGVSTRYAGRDFDSEVVLEHRGREWAGTEEGMEEWAWRLRTCPSSPGCPKGRWEVFVHNGYHEERGIEEPPTETDPRLPEGVTYEAGHGWAEGAYVYSGPNSDESICVNLWWRGHPLHGRIKSKDQGVHEDMTFALASVLLQEIGWAD